MDELQTFLARRAPGGAAYATARREADIPEVLSGIKDGVTCGAPFAAIIRNTDARSDDYDDIIDIPRPGHADYSAHIKHGGSQDVRGGGHFSGRLTAPLCIAGGICLQLLKRRGMDVFAHIAAIGGIADRPFDGADIDPSALANVRGLPFPVLDRVRGERMLEAIENAKAEGDSVGGVVECGARGLPPGLGDPMFDGMENRIAGIVFGIPGVKGIEFGSGFGGSALRGSENNDAFYYADGAVKTRTNNHGGILGGITSGMPLIFRVAIKPTPSIAQEQDSVSLSRKEDAKLRIMGRHDPCIVPRALPCVEAAAAIAIYDALLEAHL
jgi:chorismate synthase